MEFTKLHGLGNDYIYMDCTRAPVKNAPALSRLLAAPHFGVGSDGLILAYPSGKADFRMEMYNADGSRGAMCGNGIRCVGKYLYDSGYVDSDMVTVETMSGVKNLRLYIRGGKVKSVMVDMGRAELAPERVPVLLDGQRVLSRPVEIEGKP
ncbi:MAG: diaminopimelate epimerase, partial [Clostridia bacterium]|nr:diaminopimelate epimerase [Clostridia bacterium]